MKDGPVETFLAELGRRLRRDEETRRRVTAEVGDHLRDLVAEGRARGLDEYTAESQAIERFGSPRALARGLRPARRFGRTVRILGGVAAACGCVALALTFAGHRSPRVAVVTPPGGGTHVTTSAPRWCTAAFQGSGSGQDRQFLVQIDPRTGRVLGIDPRYAGTIGCAIRFTGTFARGIELPPKGSVTLATALHQ